jgi:hypothetical protein
MREGKKKEINVPIYLLPFKSIMTNQGTSNWNKLQTDRDICVKQQKQMSITSPAKSCNSNGICTFFF